MSITYEIIEGENIILAVGSGVITAKDILGHLEKLAEDDKYIAPMKKLVDYRNIDNINISPNESQIIASRKSELSSKFTGEKCAFVAPDDLTFGTSRVHQALMENADINTEVFRSIAKAMEWLNIKLKNC